MQSVCSTGRRPTACKTRVCVLSWVFSSEFRWPNANRCQCAGGNLGSVLNTVTVSYVIRDVRRPRRCHGFGTLGSWLLASFASLADVRNGRGIFWLVAWHSAIFWLSLLGNILNFANLSKSTRKNQLVQLYFCAQEKYTYTGHLQVKTQVKGLF